MVRQPPDVNRPDSPFPAATLFRALAARLPLDDPQDFANAARGKIAEIKDVLIVAKDGKVIWDRRAYDFLNGTAAPDTVNPSLWRQARLNAIHGLFEVVPDKIWQLRGYDLSVMTVIRGKTGWIVVDPLLSEEAAAAAWKLFAETVERSEEQPSELQSLMRTS